MAIARYELLTNGAATGSAVDWPGGLGTFVVDRGTFSGATVALQASYDGGTTWLAADRSGDTFTTFTAAGHGLFELPECKIRALVTGGPPSGVYAAALGVPE